MKTFLSIISATLFLSGCEQPEVSENRGFNSYCVQAIELADKACVEGVKTFSCTEPLNQSEGQVAFDCH